MTFVLLAAHDIKIKYINLLVNDKNLREFLGNNAYKKVNILSNPKIFLDSWLNILNK